MTIAFVLAAGEARPCKPAKAVELVVGTEYNCARMDDGAVRCWGGVMGWPWDTTVGWSAAREVPELAGTTRIQQAASAVVCGLASDGTVKCWSLRGAAPKYFAKGKQGAFWADPSGAAAKFGKVTDFWFNGGWFARRADGTVLRWDRGRPGPFEKPRPASGKRSATVGRVSPVPQLRHASRIVGDDRWGCAWMKDGKARCWGSGPWSSRVIGPTDYFVKSVAPSLDGAQSISHCRANWLCALLGDGTVRSWRAYYRAHSWQVEEASLPAVEKVEQVVSGEDDRICFVTEGKVKCWADSDPAPSEISGLNDVSYVGYANEHACALIRDGSVRCWGENNVGQLGDGTTDRRAGIVTVDWCPSSEQPIEFLPPAGVERIVRLERDGASAGCLSHNLSVYADGTVIYHGKGGVKVRSARGKRIAPEKVAELTTLVESTPFPRMDTEWRMQFVGSFSDHGPRDTVTVEYSRGSDHIRLDYSYSQCGVPPEVFRFEERLDEIVGSTEWTGGISSACRQWRANSACKSESIDAGPAHSR
jgi:hypothetical protein